jgi:tetrameric-type glycyl-tRNA synthetase beta subunit
VLPAYDHCLRLSHLFNVLDARGALSVTERGRFLLRCRSVAEGCAKAFFAQREEMGFPLRRLDVPDETPRQEPLEVDRSAFADKAPLLIEIGVEELPHKDVGAALAQAPRLVENYLKENGIEHGSVSAYCGPRRIAVRIEDMPARQADVEQEKRGPKKKSALDDQGNWTMPARKFAEGQGATVEDIYFEEQGKDEYCFVKLTVKGKRLVEMANDLTRGLVRGMQFGKSMGWENTTTTFSRPVRWLLALHGDKPLPVSCMLREAGEGEAERVIHSGAVTYGHRRLKPGPIEVPDANAYLDVLRERLVLADRDERMRVLREKVAARAEEAGLAAEDDDDLLQEICDLAEWPEPILCEIPDEAMVLPEPIIITPMKVHQRYIPLRGAEGKLSRRFLAVANGEHDEQGRGVIKAGNEKVLNARLRDARYFWDNDLKTPLRLFGERLNNILFHKELGSVADKITRIRDLFFTLRESLPKVDGNRMEEVLLLMKADLTTQMVYEFDSLEGVVGMLYAREQGIDDDIARAILDHRLPRRAGDSIPQERLGLVAGLLDRFDTLAGYFGIGIRPKGTSDPFGLRRNALALLSIIHQRGLDIDLDQFARAALANYGSVIHSPDNSLQALLDFMADRLEVLAREEGHHHDYVRAALAAHRRRPVRFYNCLEVMSRLDAPQVQELAEQAKRIQRIAKEPAEQFDAALLADNEQALANLLGDPADRIEDAVEEGDFSRAFDEALAWAPIISAYFEEVLVNDKDDAVRRNRHALLQRVFAGFTAPADFTAVEKREV